MCKILICYRPEEEVIAASIRKSLRLWGFSGQEISMSSTPGREIFDNRDGSELRQEAQHKADTAKLVILVYTRGNGDWTWLANLCGLATFPTTDQESAHLLPFMVLFQCFEERPKLARIDLRVSINYEQIRKFVVKMLTLDNFIGDEQAIRPDLRGEDSILDEHATTLYDDIVEAIQTVEQNQLEVSNEVRSNTCRWDFFTVELSQILVSAVEESNNIEELSRRLENESLIVNRYALGLNHFGYDFPPDIQRNFIAEEVRERSITISNLIERWKLLHKIDINSPTPEWATGIIAEIIRTIKNQYAVPPVALMKSALSVGDNHEYPHDYFYPVVNTVRRMKDRRMQFDVYMFRLAHNFPWLDSSVIFSGEAVISTDE